MKAGNLVYLVIIVFVISWIGVLPGLLLAYGYNIPSSLQNLEILMTLGPLIGAIVFLLANQGKKGLVEFFKKLLKFKAMKAVIFVAVFLPLLISFLSATLGLGMSGTEWPSAFTATVIVSNGIMIFFMYLILNTEELVWRGLVFDKLFDKYGYFKACLILIPIWGIFHLPLFLFPEGHQAGYGVFEFVFIVISQTFILGWIYIKSNRSLFYVHIHHQLINGFAQAFPIFPVFISGNKYPIWVMCVLLIVAAGILMWLYKRNPVNKLY